MAGLEVHQADVLRRLLTCHRFKDAESLILALDLGDYPSIAIVNEQERHRYIARPRTIQTQNLGSVA
jgi:hypothetical protein